jgi:hypothetical protein
MFWSFDEKALEREAASKLFDPDPFRGTLFVYRSAGASISSSFPLYGSANPDATMYLEFEASFVGKTIAKWETRVVRRTSKEVAKVAPETISLLFERDWVGGDEEVSVKIPVTLARTSSRAISPELTETIWTSSIDEASVRTLAKLQAGNFESTRNLRISVDGPPRWDLTNEMLILRRFAKRVLWYRGRASGASDSAIARELFENFGAGRSPPRD